MPTGKPLTPIQRQEIIDLRQPPHNCSYKQIVARTGRPYNTIASVCRLAGLQHEPGKAITLIHDPNDIFRPGPIEWNQADLISMLLLSDLPEGFAVTIGQHRLKVQDGCFVRNDGFVCPPNHSGTLKWYRSEGTE